MKGRKKIVLADYISYTDRNGQPIGHPLKIMQEYAQWIKKDYDVMYAAHKAYMNSINGEKLELPYRIGEEYNFSSIKGKVYQLLISWINISYIWYYSKDAYVWFYNIDIFLIFYLLLHKKQRKKTIISTYLLEFEKKYQNRIFRYILPQIHLMICSNKHCNYNTDNVLFIPDYLYNDEIYNQYKLLEKEEKVVCVGTMREGEKELESLVEVFNCCAYPLEIIGYFHDKNLYHKLCKKAKPNIVIRDMYLDYDIYLKLLGTAKFCILPYRKEVYSIKTSGVLLESIFCGAVPICDEELLKIWKISGIGYTELLQFHVADELQVNCDEIIKKNEKLIDECYKEQIYIEQLLEKVKK